MKVWLKLKVHEILDYFRAFSELKQTCFSHNSRDRKPKCIAFSGLRTSWVCHVMSIILCRWGTFRLALTPIISLSIGGTLVCVPADMELWPHVELRAGWFLTHSGERCPVHTHTFLQVNPSIYHLPCEQLLPTFVCVCVGWGSTHASEMIFFRSGKLHTGTQVQHPFQRHLHSSSIIGWTYVMTTPKMVLHLKLAWSPKDPPLIVKLYLVLQDCTYTELWKNSERDGSQTPPNLPSLRNLHGIIKHSWEPGHRTEQSTLKRNECIKAVCCHLFV